MELKLGFAVTIAVCSIYSGSVRAEDTALWNSSHFPPEAIRIDRHATFNKYEDGGRSWLGGDALRAEPDEYFCGYQLSITAFSNADLEVFDIDPNGAVIHVSVANANASGRLIAMVAGRYVKKHVFASESDRVARCGTDGWRMDHYKASSLIEDAMGSRAHPTYNCPDPDVPCPARP